MTDKHPRHLLATIISDVFDPFIMIVPLMVAALFKSAMPPGMRETFFAVFLMGMVAPPALLLALAVKTGRVSNWDVSDQQERKVALGVLLVFAIIDVILVRIFGNAFLFSLFVFLLMWLVGFYAITLFWKISGHTGVSTLAIGLIALWFESWWGVLFLLIPIIAWARVVIHRHTPMQTVAGAVYSLATLTLWRIIS